MKNLKKLSAAFAALFLAVLLIACGSGKNGEAPSGQASCEHEAVIDAAVEATCTKEGKTEGSHCQKCGEVLKAQATVGAKGHTWQEATCTEAMTCSECGETEGEAKGHEWFDADCVDPKTCAVCFVTEGNALGHQWQEATCTKAKTCSVCEATEGEALGHTWQDATCENAQMCSVCKETKGSPLVHKWKPATCTEPKTCTVCLGTTGQALGHQWQGATCTESKTCTVCKIIEGEALGHVWQDATCTEPKTCDGCGETIGEALGHQWQEATCTEAKKCSNCSMTDGEAQGHNYKDYVCTVCDLPQVSQGLKYELSGNQYTVVGIGSCTDREILLPDTYMGKAVTAIGSNAFKNQSNIQFVLIREGITSIGSSAFEGCSSLMSITIPDNVIEIGERAFMGCTNLESFDIPEGITKIAKYMLADCFSLADIVIPNKVMDIGKCAFKNCKALTSIVVPNSVTSISIGVFYGCTGLTEITLPFVGSSANATETRWGVFGYIFGDDDPDDDSMNYNGSIYMTSGTSGYTTQSLHPDYLNRYFFFAIPKSIHKVTITNQTIIPAHAFQNCDLIKEITFQKPVSYVGEYAFDNCHALKTLSYSVAEDTIIQEYAFSDCDSLTVAVIPNGVLKIGSYAFEDCDALSSVTIPNSVKSIGKCAFKNCNSLTSLVVPNSVTSISFGAFYGCTGLVEITLPFVGSSANATETRWGVFGYIFGDDNPDDDSMNYNGSIYMTSGTSGYTSQSVHPDYSNRYYFFAIPKSIRKVTITNQTVVPAYAFQNCDLIKEITFQKPVSYVGEYAFEYCRALKTLSYSVVEDTIIQEYAFSDCDSLDCVLIPSGVLKIGSYAFEDCNALSSVTIPDSVKSIGKCAFKNCKALTSIVVPNSVTSISMGAFYGCTGLVEITLPFVGSSANATETRWGVFGYIFGDDDPDDDSMNYNGSIYMTSGTSGYTTQSLHPDYLNRYFFFAIPKSIRKVTITNQTVVPAYAFQNCDLIKEITFLKPVITIGQSAFENCTLLSTICYGGTKAQWDEIFFEANWNKNAGAYTINYNCNIETSKTFTVTFKDYDGRVLKTQSGIAQGAAATAPAAPIRDGYTFAGWDKAFSNVTSDMVVTATYTPVASGACLHANKVYMDYQWDDIKYMDASSHSVKITYRYRCNACRTIITDTAGAELKTEAHVHDFSVNGGYVCRCGHIENVNFTAYKANLQSDINRATYYDPALTVNYGTVYVSDEITVIGSTENAYLIKYPLDAGGYKFAFIEKKYIDQQTYQKNSSLDVFVNGKAVSAINNNGTIYVNLDELMNAFGDHAAFVTKQNGYNVTIRVRNTKNKENYTLNIDLTNYQTKNWADIYAKKVGDEQNIPGFCIGAYIYTNSIFIELQELMDLLSYQNKENCYVPSEINVDLTIYQLALLAYNESKSSHFDGLYEEVLGNPNLGWFTSFLYNFLTLDWDYILTNDYYDDEELVDAIKAMLYARAYPVNPNGLNVSSDATGALADMLLTLGSSAETFGKEMGMLGDIFESKGLKQSFETLKTYIDSFSAGVKAGGVAADGMEFVNMCIEEVAVMWTLAYQYEENMAVLDLLIEMETNPKVIAIYQKVKDQLMPYYANKVAGAMDTIANNEKIKRDLNDKIFNIAKDLILDKASSNPLFLAYQLTIMVGDSVLHGDALYNAQDGLYTIHNTIELYNQSLKTAITNYYDNPTRANLDYLFSTTLIAFQLRLQALDYSIEYVGSLWVRNDTTEFEAEKTDIINYMELLKNRYNNIAA